MGVPVGDNDSIADIFAKRVADTPAKTAYRDFDSATSTWREVKAEPVKTNYQRFVEAVRTGVQADPDFRHAAELQKILDLALVADLDRKEHRV